MKDQWLFLPVLLMRFNLRSTLLIKYSKDTLRATPCKLLQRHVLMLQIWGISCHICLWIFNHSRLPVVVCKFPKKTADLRSNIQAL